MSNVMKKIKPLTNIGELPDKEAVIYESTLIL